MKTPTFDSVLLALKSFKTKRLFLSIMKEPGTIDDLSDRFYMHKASIGRNIQMLRECGLVVSMREDSRKVIYQADEKVANWINEGIKSLGRS